ncbi:hypothetical protein [Peptoniphilus catoniae]|uniref:hypothetical protein n=1 Tax=Peptoniphilus catoniae TaxID=1660341 RepID=UPI0010FDF265|nr:hypothetical protein [Peptoniphilus catoniae]
MIQSFDFFVANPAGNITGFVVWPVYPGFRPAYTKAIMEQIDSSVEQVGFISPSYDGPPLRLDMAGGEFCGNATRAYGLYSATFLEEKGEYNMEVYVSGIDHPIYVLANTINNTAYIELPEAISVGELEVEGKSYKIVELSGITHVIIDDRKEDKDFVKKVIDAAKNKIESKAYGVLFYNKEDSSMVPYVEVVEADTLVRESSCASGTVALGYYLNNDKRDENFKATIHQPNGELELTCRINEEGKLVFTIGGPVEISETKKVKIDISKEVEEKVKAEYLAKKKLEEEASKHEEVKDDEEE